MGRLEGILAAVPVVQHDRQLASGCEPGQPLDAEADRQGRRTRHEYFVDPIIRDQLVGLSADEFWLHFNRHLLEAVEKDVPP